MLREGEPARSRRRGHRRPPLPGPPRPLPRGGPRRRARAFSPRRPRPSALAGPAALATAGPRPLATAGTRPLAGSGARPLVAASGGAFAAFRPPAARRLRGRSPAREDGRRRRVFTRSNGRPCAALQPLDLLGRERAELPRLEPARRHRPEGDAPELGDRVAHGLQHALHLVVLALVQRHLDPRVVVGLEHPHAVDGHQLALHRHAAPQPLERALVRDAVHLRLVDARHLVARVRHALGEDAVVREQDQALGGDVEPAHGEQPRDLRHEVHHGGPALGVLARRHVAPGLVEHDVDRRPSGPSPARRRRARRRARGRPSSRARARARR